MNAEIQKILRAHHCYLEVSPYFSVAEDRPVGEAPSVQRVHAGFDLDIYGEKVGDAADPPAEYWLVYEQLKDVAGAIGKSLAGTCSVDVIPFGSTIVLDSRNHLQPMAMLRIRVRHEGDIHERAGDIEQQVAKAVEAQLKELGVAEGRGRS